MTEQSHQFRSHMPEAAPSELATEEPSVARLFGFLGLGAAVVGGLALWFNVSKPRLVGPTTGIFLTLLGACFMLYHAARDRDRMVRRLYIALGLAGLGVGTALTLIPQPKMGDWFLPWGVCGLFTGLFFLLAAGRHEDESPWPGIVAGTIALLGVALTLGGLVGVGLLVDYVPRFAGFAIVGILFWWAALSRIGVADILGYRFGQLLGAIGLAAFLWGLGRSFGPDRYFVPRGVVLAILGSTALLFAYGTCSDRAVVAMTRRELSAYFYSPIAYIVFFGTVIVGWLNYLFLFQYLMESAGRPVPEPITQQFSGGFFSWITACFVVPVITMRLLSEERRTGTIEVLLTAPVSEWQVVLSKFTAGLLYFLVLFLPWTLFLIPIYQVGRFGFDYLPLVSYFLALVVTGAAFIATGLFCSSLTRNQIIAAVLAFAAMIIYLAVPFYLGASSSMSTTPLQQLSFIEVWSSCMNGTLPLHQLLVYLSLAVFWLYLTTKVLEGAEVELTMTATTNSAGGLVGWLARERSMSGRALIGVGVVLLALAGYLIIQALPKGLPGLGPEGGESASKGLTGLDTDYVGLVLGLWVAVGSLAAMIGGSMQLAGEPPPERRDLSARYTLLTVVGIFGVATFILGIALLNLWSKAVVSLLREGDRAEAWKVLVALVTILAGLIIMFLGLQAVRADERREAGLRRLIYGYNAFLTGFLLLAVLLIANILSYMKVPGVIDMTQSGVYSISPRSKQILGEIDRPTQIFAIMSGREMVYQDIQSLLTVCQEQNPKLRVDYLTQMQPNRIRELARTFPQVNEDLAGLLVVYGEEKPENASFIRSFDLYSTDFAPGGGEPKRKFMGEVKLMNELSFLMGGKDKPIIYVTQGSGEPDLNDRAKPQGLGSIKEKLERRSFDVRPLKLGAFETKVPDDAKVVVVAGPKQTLPPAAVDALKGYMDRGGKMLALFDVEGTRNDREMPPTGLEGVMAGFGVDVTKERVQTVPTRDVSSPEEALLRVDEASENTPIGSPFRAWAMQFFTCRVIRPLQLPHGASQFLVRKLFSTRNSLVWTETDLQVSGMQTYRLMQNDLKVRERITNEPLPVAVTVSEVARAMPGTPPGPEKPRLVVFGDADFICNGIARAGGEMSSIMFDIVAGSLDWLRERPSNIGIEPRVAQTYEMDPTARDKEAALKFVPLLVAVLAVIGLGLGVWLVRRQ